MNALYDEIDRLKRVNAELLAACKRLSEYGDIFRYKQWEISPYKQLKEAIDHAEEKLWNARLTTFLIGLIQKNLSVSFGV